MISSVGGVVLVIIRGRGVSDSGSLWLPVSIA